MSKNTILALATGLGFAAGAHAAAAAELDFDAINERLPGVERDSISDAPIDGLFEIALGPQVVYVSGDGRYLVQGDIIDLEKNVNMTDRRRNDARATMLSEIPEDEVIAFAPENVEHTITVFTDIDCGYCRKLHQEMDDLHELGVKVQYMFFPRSGPGSRSWQKAESVWCANDRNTALTSAKAGQDPEPKSCESPVAEQYEIGKMVGLRGTPAIVTEDGELISGYLPAKQLVARIEQMQAR